MDLVNQLLKSASLGNVAEVEECLKRGCSVDLQDSEGTSPLHAASANGSDSVVLLLLSNNAFVDLRNAHGWTPLMLAAKYGHTSTVSHLIECRARVNVHNKIGVTPLSAAVESGNISTVEMLLENGAITDYTLPEMTHQFDLTPLMVAALLGYDSIVAILLAAGASPNYCLSITGWSPLMFASCNDQLHIVQMLTERGADNTKVDVYGRTAIDISHISSERETKDNMENVWSSNMHADKSGSINSDDPVDGNNANPKSMVSALLLASIHGRPEVVQSLIENGVDLNARDAVNGCTALMYAVYNRHYKVVKQLIRGGADIYAAADEGYTAFDLATCLDKSDSKIIKALTAKMRESLDFSRPDSISTTLTLPITSRSKSFSVFSRSPRRSIRRSMHSKGLLDGTTRTFSRLFSRLSTRKSNCANVPVIKIEDLAGSDDVFDSNESSLQCDDLPKCHVIWPVTKSPEQLLAKELKKHCFEPVIPPFPTTPAVSDIAMESPRRMNQSRTPSFRGLSTPNLLKNHMKNVASRLSPGVPVSEGFHESDFAAYGKEDFLQCDEKSRSFSNSAPQPLELQLPNDDSLCKEKLRNPSSLTGLLKVLSLEKHINKFKEQEIDLEAFQCLKDDDFLEIGIDSTLSRESLSEILRNLQRTSDV